MHILSVKTADYKSDPPIMIAIDCGYKDITKLLLEHKQLKINEKARSGHTPLSEFPLLKTTTALIIRPLNNLISRDTNG